MLIALIRREVPSVRLHTDGKSVKLDQWLCPCQVHKSIFDTLSLTGELWGEPVLHGGQSEDHPRLDEE